MNVLLLKENVLEKIFGIISLRCGKEDVMKTVGVVERAYFVKNSHDENLK